MQLSVIFRSMALVVTSGYTFGGWGQTMVPERPNFVWFMAEDVSKHYLQLYNADGSGAVTPNVSRLAKEGIVFENAYSNAPVSSAARSTLITGCYATRLGVSFHRKLEQVPMPEGLNMFPGYLRQAGYHTSNAAKTDYNCFLDKTAWDIVSAKMGDWRKRRDKSQPFFHVRTNAMTHESKLHFPETAVRNVAIHNNPADVKVHPFHPDTELFRYTYASFYDCIQKSDKELGKMMAMLEEDGELDNTFIFYFGDNGGSLPGTKGYTNELGLQVPLVVYIPKNWRNRLQVELGGRADGFVSFIDFGPTLLHLAGIDVPEKMDGTPFMGVDISWDKLNSRNEVYGYGDRFDELYAFNRTVRKGNFKYSRNYQPYHPKSLYALYRYNQAAFREWARLYKQGKLNIAQSRFFQPQGAEELYDLSVDPFETHNLAMEHRYSEKLKDMRDLLKNKLLKDGDLGFYPECVWLKLGRTNPTGFAQDHRKELSAYMHIADLQLSPFSKAREELEQALQSEDAVMRYWAITTCASFGKEAKVFEKYLKELLTDSNAYVAGRALVALNQFSRYNNPAMAKKLLQRASSGAESLLILNDIAYLHWEKGEHFDLTMTDIPYSCEGVDWRLLYINGKDSSGAEKQTF